MASRACSSERERPFAVDGNCSRCRRNAEARNGRVPGAGFDHPEDRSRVGRAESLPGRATEGKLLFRRLAAIVEQSQQPFRSERPQIFVRMHDAQPRIPEVASREPVEHLDELQLIVEVVFEEEHDLLVVSVARKRRVACREVPSGLRQVRPSALREEAGAYVGKLFQREPVGDGALVQHVPPAAGSRRPGPDAPILPAAESPLVMKSTASSFHHKQQEIANDATQSIVRQALTVPYP